ncbi:ATP-binding protein [Streptacidiphilus sp. ASG 303]|uniref:sensor histidine kinase n=1 Tax=Streptacidiphilus sp. ASG 303 TaxID=2896847 RepID=UPI0021057339|nr:ATP-binding protein [Streptacidiphilus sp. ASG 303]
MPSSLATRRPGARPPVRRVLPVLLLAAAVTGVAVLCAALAAADAARAAVAVTAAVAAVLLTAAATAAARAAQSAQELRLRARTAEEEAARSRAELAQTQSDAFRLRDRLAHLDAETARLRSHTAQLDAHAAVLADDLLPSLVKRVRDGASAGTALAELHLPADTAHRRVLEVVAHELSVSERSRAAAMSACANAAGRVQALATSMLADLRRMEERHGEEVMGDLMKLDHATAQAGRLADSIAVLTGARSGRRWTKPIVMESILRGAMGRISAYQRVRLHSTCSAAVAGYAAEGVMHALAELMDNATSFSAPTEEVHVYVEEVAAGVVVTIEDGGLVMNPEKLGRAQRAVSATEPLDFTTMSSTRLGLAVVGCLARKHRLTVSFRPSSRGGTGAVVLIPRELVTQQRQDQGAAPAAVPAPAAARAVLPRPATGEPRAERTPRAPQASRTAPAPQAPPMPRTAPAVPAPADSAPVAPAPAAARGVEGAEAEVHGLPKRPRGQTLAAASRHERPSEPVRQQPRPGAGERFRAFRQAVRGGGSEDTGSHALGPGGTGPHTFGSRDAGVRATGFDPTGFDDTGFDDTGSHGGPRDGGPAGRE